MAFKIPPSYKLRDLKIIAFKCGISTSGTKTAIIQRLADEITSPKHGFEATLPRILSIDLGIRNLAYCMLEVSPDATTNVSAPKITSWRRIAVLTAPMAEKSSIDHPTKEVFDPPTLSRAAYSLLRHTLLPHNPTHILIERQRFRSMGSPHVLEWTVRVNMLESIFYATLHTLRAENIWHGEVVPISPGKVGPFWIEPLCDETSALERKVRSTKSAKALNKGAKIDLVKHWLESSKMLALGSPDAEQTAAGYLQKWHRLPGGKKGAASQSSGNTEQVEEVGKLDDLADSLLQGLAWIRWQENKNLVLTKGVDALNLIQHKK